MNGNGVGSSLSDTNPDFNIAVCVLDFIYLGLFVAYLTLGLIRVRWSSSIECQAYFYIFMMVCSFIARSAIDVMIIKTNDKESVQFYLTQLGAGADYLTEIWCITFVFQAREIHSKLHSQTMMEF